MKLTRFTRALTILSLSLLIFPAKDGKAQTVLTKFADIKTVTNALTHGKKTALAVDGGLNYLSFHKNLAQAKNISIASIQPHLSAQVIKASALDPKAETVADLSRVMEPQEVPQLLSEIKRSANGKNDVVFHKAVGNEAYNLIINGTATDGKTTLQDIAHSTVKEATLQTLEMGGGTILTVRFQEKEAPVQVAQKQAVQKPLPQKKMVQKPNIQKPVPPQKTLSASFRLRVTTPEDPLAEPL